MFWAAPAQSNWPYASFRRTLWEQTQLRLNRNVGEGDRMKHLMLAGAVVLSVMSAGCATKKYVAQTVAPVETHVANVESKNDAKNADQDKTIAGQGQQIQDLD